MVGWLPLVKSSGLLLDTLSATASLAYSSRKLKAAYGGSALQTQSTVNVGFNGSGDLDTSGLSGTNSIKIWYDQSGNVVNATQNTGGRQPIIQSSGSLITQNGHVWQQAISANQTSMDFSLPLSQPFTIAALFKFANVNVGNTLVGDFNTALVSIGINSGPTLVGFAGVNFNGGTPDTSLHTLFFIANGASSNVIVDGVSHLGNAGTNNIGAQNQLWEFAGDGNLGEFMIFPVVLGAGDLNLIRTSWQSYWGAP